MICREDQNESVRKDQRSEAMLLIARATKGAPDPEGGGLKRHDRLWIVSQNKAVSDKSKR